MEMSIENSHLNKALNILREIFQLKNFTKEQIEIITEITNKKNVIALLPTGAGKSICYQIPALLLDGTAIVISPLIALMDDQVLKLQNLNIAAYSLSRNTDEISYRVIKSKLYKNKIKILYISPERLSLFNDILDQINISFFAIDEAHCIIQWGSDFRPEYLKIGIIIKNNNKPCIALTASANSQMLLNIKNSLNITDAKVVKASFNRSNLFYIVEKIKNQDSWEFWLMNKLNLHKNQTGIIYCLSREKVEKVAFCLHKNGFNAHYYHAVISKVKKDEILKKFLNSKDIIIVATVAFGMGIDKQSVRFVIHLDLPKNLESYYQETGRSGRDLLPSFNYLLYKEADFSKMLRMIKRDGLDLENKIKQLEKMKLFADTKECRRVNLLRYFNEINTECNYCDNCLKKFEIINTTQNANYILSAIYHTKGKVFFDKISDILNGIDINYKNLSVYGKLNNPNLRRLFKDLIKYQFVKRKKGLYSITPKCKILFQQKTQLLDVINIKDID